MSPSHDIPGDCYERETRTGIPPWELQDLACTPRRGDVPPSECPDCLAGPRDDEVDAPSSLCPTGQGVGQVRAAEPQTPGLPPPTIELVRHPPVLPSPGDLP